MIPQNTGIINFLQDAGDCYKRRSVVLHDEGTCYVDYFNNRRHTQECCVLAL